MDKKVVGLLGAVAAGVALTPAASYADLLNPVQNAVEVLKADNAAREAHVQLADWVWNGYSWEWRVPVPTPYEVPYYEHHHHHHHHHNHWYHHHHHHHYHED